MVYFGNLGQFDDAMGGGGGELGPLDDATINGTLW